MQISLLQWNIWYKGDIRDIADFLEANRADILCLQELMRDWPEQTITDTAKYIAERLNYFYYEKLIKIKGQVGEQSSAIFSRFPISDQKFVWINQPTGAGGYDDEYRAYLEVSVDIGDKKLKVATTHMSYTDRLAETDRKADETDQLMRQLSKNKSNFLFAGDLNSTPESYTIRQINKHLKHAGPDYAQKTWTTKPFEYENFKVSKLDWRLDYVFASPDIEVVDAKLLSTTHSDHLPIWIDLLTS